MSSLRILLVDDSAVVRLVIAKQLEMIGFVIDTAEDGAVAVEAVRKNEYDLIFMDVMMPVLDGLQATREIRMLELETGRQPVPIVGVTGYTNRGECIDAGMNDFLFKPVTTEQLKGAIKNWHPDTVLPGATPLSVLLAEKDEANLPAPAELAAQRLADLKRRLGFKAAS
jgi:CheY-like chemotaxis protein